MPAHEGLIKRLTTGFVHENGRWAVVGQPIITPAHERNERRRQRGTLLGEPIFESRRSFAVLALNKHSSVDEPVKAIS